MGLRYILYRMYHIFLKKSKIALLIYPSTYKEKKWISLEDWKLHAKPFFFKNREALPYWTLAPEEAEILKNEYNQLKNGQMLFFSNQWMSVESPFNWFHNPDSLFSYNPNTHWTQIPDLSEVSGDIKYVWEISRFSFLYTIIRHDQHLKKDSSEWVFALINDWIDKNKLNKGPNYVCSQEISLRILNWIFALYYYQNSKNLSNELFIKILNSINWQWQHVYKNINFSRYTVRNNHAITETLCLYLVGILFPSLPNATAISKLGFRYFEQEISYQIYRDGSYLQFSMNYHRVVVQLLTWALQISKLNGIKHSPMVLDRAQKTASFLTHHQDLVTGKLPNYGANDGALFFKLNNKEFRNYKPQLNALQVVLKSQNLYECEVNQEDAWWYTGGKLQTKEWEPPHSDSIYKAPIGGFYVLRNQNYFATLRCGNHKDRPQQADQNHLDIWYNGHNILRDNGSFKYNTDKELVKYFTGTASHNTVQIDDFDQMQKGSRFIWNYWSQAKNVQTHDHKTYLEITAEAFVYKHLGEIVHKRQVKQFTEQAKWEIIDELQIPQKFLNHEYHQNWHISDNFTDLGFEIVCFDAKGNPLKAVTKEVWYSDVYGTKVPSQMIRFTNSVPYFNTLIFKKIDSKIA